MTKKQYFEYHAWACKRLQEITAAKNADYTGEGDNPFANFTRVEALGITDTVRGFLVRMTDKLSRVNSFAQKGILQVKDESVEDTLLDLANYCILLAGYIKSIKQPTQDVQMEFSFTAPSAATKGSSNSRYTEEQMADMRKRLKEAEEASAQRRAERDAERKEKWIAP